MTARRSTGPRATGPRPAGRAARRRSVSPGLIILATALIGTLLFGLYTITVRDASQIPLLAAGGVALGIVFVALALYLLRSTWRAGAAGLGRRAMGLAIVGGISAIVGFGCIAMAVILFLLSRPPG
jgi:hypothetical protein